jgi:hypothetical protein
MRAPPSRRTHDATDMCTYPLRASGSMMRAAILALLVLGSSATAQEPTHLWIVPASNHRFSDNLAELSTRLLEALAWVRQQGR